MAKQQKQVIYSNLHEVVADTTEQIRLRVVDAIADEFFHDFKALIPTPSGAPTGILESLAERADKLLRCAELLFAGYVDGATNFAQTHGGGCGSDDRDWGRKDDEDDRRWARRRLLRASQMMRPATSRRCHR